MPYVCFHEYFPELAERETRSITIPKRLSSGLPAGEYGFLEMYCDERGCDCRRVFFYVISPPKKEPLAIVAYGWESPEFYARWMGDNDPEIIRDLQGPVLNMGSPQCNLAPAILKLVKDVVLQDRLYIERIKNYYLMFRDKIDRKLQLKRRKKRGRIGKKRKV